MDLRIGGAYEQALLKLAQFNQEPTATGMVRMLIRNAAMEIGAWPSFEQTSLKSKRPNQAACERLSDDPSEQSQEMELVN